MCSYETASVYTGQDDAGWLAGMTRICNNRFPLARILFYTSAYGYIGDATITDGSCYPESYWPADAAIFETYLCDTPTCTDPAGGDYQVFDTASGFDPEWNMFYDYADRCETDYELRERSCDANDLPTREVIDCRDIYGAGWFCDAGQCVGASCSEGDTQCFDIPGVSYVQECVGGRWENIDACDPGYCSESGGAHCFTE